MKRLPGRSQPRWLQQLLAWGVLVIATIWLVTFIPLLLVLGLIAAVLMIPVLRQLRQEIDKLERSQRGEPEPPRDVTPWHRRAWNRWLNR